MSALEHGKHHAKIPDLPLPNPAAVKGGSTMLSSAASNVVDSLGGALKTVARV